MLLLVSRRPAGHSQCNIYICIHTHTHTYIYIYKYIYIYILGHCICTIIYEVVDSGLQQPHSKKDTCQCQVCTTDSRVKAAYATAEECAQTQTQRTVVTRAEVGRQMRDMVFLPGVQQAAGDPLSPYCAPCLKQHILYGVSSHQATCQGQTCQGRKSNQQARLCQELYDQSKSLMSLP